MCTHKASVRITRLHPQALQEICRVLKPGGRGALITGPDRTRRVLADRSTVPYRCTIDVRTHTGPSGVPTGPPGPCRDPTDPRRTAGGTVGPRFIGASPVWAARSSYWRQPWLLHEFKEMLDLTSAFTPSRKIASETELIKNLQFVMNVIPDLFQIAQAYLTCYDR